jgi:peptidylprolyl isomerase/peptidyl-prolyl cis-trans isomerase-like 1
MTHLLIAFPIVLVAGALFTSAFGQGKEPAGKEAEAAKKETAVIETSLGTFEVVLYRADAPRTVENFVKLAGQKYFDGQRFHRVSKNFVIQAGDELSKDTSKAARWGTGGRSIYGKEFQDELNPATPSFKEGYKKGVVAMANRGPNTNTSQFFVMLRDNPGMPKNYTIFGKVVKGMETVDKIGQTEIVPGMSQNDGRPKPDVVISKVTIRTEPAK